MIIDVANVTIDVCINVTPVSFWIKQTNLVEISIIPIFI
jgi:hypothetical protein